jgi:hypothetical protein
MLYAGRDLVTGMMRACAPASSAFSFHLVSNGKGYGTSVLLSVNIVVFVALVRHLKKTTAVREIEFQHRNTPGTNFTSHRSIEFSCINMDVITNKTRHVKSFHPSPRW